MCTFVLTTSPKGAADLQVQRGKPCGCRRVDIKYWWNCFGLLPTEGAVYAHLCVKVYLLLLKKGSVTH